MSVIKWVVFPKSAPRLIRVLCDHLPGKHVCVPGKVKVGRSSPVLHGQLKTPRLLFAFCYVCISSSVKPNTVSVCGLLGHTIKLSNIWSN